MPAKLFPRSLVPAVVLLVALLAFEAPALAGPPKVELFVTSGCPYCIRAKAYFDAKGVPYTAFDIEKDPAANMRFQKYGVRGVPLVVIGDVIIPGFSTAEFDKALAAGGKAAPAQPKMVFGN
ncbi:glutaredoxin family protein [Solidesulfovibrio sp.]|uniref:glutaredoxin family protein n=1 Tax=Solidesulfovibrio sp. TaxID=2910990 RepID=UPI002B20D687|nr:glutaredoxin domain-containing protein [Solidesulfovibrio sp.]MEA5089418.1 glutaredoxin domain-containing protein [Solidesulfovibrio sp.]